MKHKIYSELAPQAIGPYSQAIRAGKTVYLSGQIPLDPVSGELVKGDISEQTERVLMNLREVCRAAGGNLDKIVKLTIFLTDLANFAAVNEMMTKFLHEPYPARSTIQVSALPKGAEVEVEAVMVL
jgi:reactive intermediate/imine deaminase